MGVYDMALILAIDDFQKRRQARMSMAARLRAKLAEPGVRGVSLTPAEILELVGMLEKT